MQKRSIFAALAAVAVTFTAAYAYTLDENGNGFVGKGEVQTVFALNNAGMQAVHQLVTFDYDETTVYGFECEWWTGPDHNRRYHTAEVTVPRGLQSAVASDSRRTGQFTGWTLSGFTGGGDVGQPTDADCGAEGNEMKSIIPGTVEVLSTSGGLYATIGGDRRLIP